jgi:mRNA interferase YafQ
MKYKITTIKAFEKDLKKLSKSGKNISKLRDVVATLADDKKLAAKHRPHILSGNWKGRWECHIEPDWLLIWRYDADEIILERTGSHANLFG